MSLDKAIKHGKEKRKPYRGSKAVDHTCRNHGSCSYCEMNRKISTIRRLESEKAALLEIAKKDCCYCKHYFNDNADGPCVDCTTKNLLWEWRGVEEDDHATD